MMQLRSFIYASSQAMLLLVHSVRGENKMVTNKQM